MVVHRAIGRSTGPATRSRSGRAAGPGRPGPLSALLLGLLLSISVVATSFDLHSHAAHDADHAIAAGADHGELPVFSGASHPHQAPHVETSGRMVTFRCPVCLLHFQSLGDADRHAPGARLPSATGRVRASTASLLRDPLRHSGGSRGPPSSLTIA